MLVKGLPLAYNRDLQEDKAAAVRRPRHGGRLAGAGRRPGAARRASAREVIAARLEDGFLDATT